VKKRNADIVVMSAKEALGQKTFNKDFTWFDVDQ